MLECETWYELAGQRYNVQGFRIPRADVASLRHAVAAIRRRNPAFHLRVSLQRPAFDPQQNERAAVA